MKSIVEFINPDPRLLRTDTQANPNQIGGDMARSKASTACIWKFTQNYIVLGLIGSQMAWSYLTSKMDKQTMEKRKKESVLHENVYVTVFYVVQRQYSQI